MTKKKMGGGEGENTCGDAMRRKFRLSIEQDMEDSLPRLDRTCTGDTGAVFSGDVIKTIYNRQFSPLDIEDGGRGCFTEPILLAASA